MRVEAGSRVGREALQGARLIAMGAFMLLACAGCGSDDQAANKPPDKKDEKKKEEPKPDFELNRLMTRPNSVEAIETAAKPGHWTSATQDAIANNFDYNGVLALDPVVLPGLPIDLGGARPAILPKGQAKALELLVYLPPGTKRSLGVRLLTERDGSTRLETLQPVALLPPWQYHLVVLSRQPDRFAYLRGLDTIKPPSGDLDDGSSLPAHYRVSLPPLGKTVPLPSDSIAWTSIAAVIWDDFDPTVLSLDQQTALVDWLHWGGTLITSGPATLDALRATYLDPYLPAQPDGTTDLPEEVVAGLNDRWTFAPARPLEARAPWTIQKLVPRPTSSVIDKVGDHNLVVVRRVGRGRVVSVAFSLGHRELTVWPDFDQFLNVALLGRSRRAFEFDRDMQALRMRWVNTGSDVRDPRLVTNVRYFSRDTGKALPQRPPDRVDLFAAPQSTGVEDEPVGGSPGGWDDFNGVANAAREVLISASGLEVPSARFVLTTLAVYLIVLVPVNWGIFRAIGRVEWAWIAAPFITVIFALAVVRLAQLNIGFARAESELALVELQPDYRRAHVTRYTSLYTSLATNYAAVLADRGGVALPFPTQRGNREATEIDNTVTMFRGPEVRLDNYRVASNSLGMLHSEHMLDFGGGVMSEPIGDNWRVINNSAHNLAAAAVVRGSDIAWLGDLQAGASREVPIESFGAIDSANDVRDKWRAWLKANRPLEGNLETIVELMLHAANETDESSLRVLALVTDDLPGLRIEPSAEQRRHLSLVVAQLRYPEFPDLVPEHETRSVALAKEGINVEHDALLEELAP